MYHKREHSGDIAMCEQRVSWKLSGVNKVKDGSVIHAFLVLLVNLLYTGYRRIICIIKENIAGDIVMCELGQRGPKDGSVLNIIE